ncbi:MAG: tRNA (guanine-N(1)-)-methyltransferase [Candidatus Collierbacteria bacterium GW2011_GWB1_45_35]|nr:MAG: tRNA (guanine-N(1)-)-methyltransferase [Candidatus Collierbacteria bacterium GW2011_GWB1_45_35]
MFEGVFKTSIIGRATGTRVVDIKVHNLRDWSDDNYKSVDDRPFGGGAGMVMRVDVVERAIKELKNSRTQELKTRVILMDTKGKMYDQKVHRVHEHLADEVYSIGPYVLSGGELPVMVVVDSLCRLLPGVLGNSESLKEESYSEEMEIEYPQYTRPAEYKGWKVPEVLLSGDHKKIEAWRKKR